EGHRWCCWIIPRCGQARIRLFRREVTPGDSLSPSRKSNLPVMVERQDGPWSRLAEGLSIGPGQTTEERQRVRLVRVHAGGSQESGNGPCLTQVLHRIVRVIHGMCPNTPPIPPGAYTARRAAPTERQLGGVKVACESTN